MLELPAKDRFFHGGVLEEMLKNGKNRNERKEVKVMAAGFKPERVKREAKRLILSTMHAGSAKLDKLRVNGILKNYDMETIENVSPARKKRITFVITRMVRFHGGQTSILRLGTQLARLGYDVVYAVYKEQSREEMKLCAESNLKGYKGRVCTREQFMKLHSDIWVASSWDTVSFVKKKAGYKMYFVQDYEPYFYPFGERFLLAKKTYEQGLHMVSLGKWNKEMIEKECHPVSPVDVIDFPYERSEYPYYPREYETYQKKKEFTIAVYLKFYGKRLPTILPYMLSEVKERFQAEGITLHICYFGEAKSFRVDGGENLGMLKKEELLSLYKRADFGMVASLSNISLVPYEMIGTGLPVIEFIDGTFSHFFPENSAILIDISCDDLYEKLKLHIQEPKRLEVQHENAFSYMKDLSWEKSGEQFAEIIEGI